MHWLNTETFQRCCKYIRKMSQPSLTQNINLVSNCALLSMSNQKYGNISVAVQLIQLKSGNCISLLSIKSHFLENQMLGSLTTAGMLMCKSEYCTVAVQMFSHPMFQITVVTAQ